MAPDVTAGTLVAIGMQLAQALDSGLFERLAAHTGATQAAEPTESAGRTRLSDAEANRLVADARAKSRAARASRFSQPPQSPLLHARGASMAPLARSPRLARVHELLLASPYAQPVQFSAFVDGELRATGRRSRGSIAAAAEQKSGGHHAAKSRAAGAAPLAQSRCAPLIVESTDDEAERRTEYKPLTPVRILVVEEAL